MRFCCSVSAFPAASIRQPLPVRYARPSPRGDGRPHYAPPLLRMAAIVPVIKVSDEDLRQLFPGDADPFATLRTLAPQADILLTLGADGMEWLAAAHGGQDDARIAQPAFAVPVADTVGCGDAAMGAWLASQLHSPGAPVQAHLRRAAAAAALTATRAGAYAGTQAEIDALLQVHAPRTPETG
ncbi:PfkB family carbohydrate kinase [Ralstonia pickettii]|nr:PfkB family carbohydrate kinase [Ralstonia pickettii]